MAKTTKKTKTSKSSPQATLTKDQLMAMWEQLPAGIWVDVAKKSLKLNQFIQAKPNHVIGKCINPDHEDSTASFHIYTDKKYCKCFGCGYFETNPITVLSQILKTDTAETVSYLRDVLGLTSIPKNAVKDLEEQSIIQGVKQFIYAESHRYMCLAIADPENPAYAFAAPTISWLTDHRKLPIETLHALPIGVLPPVQVLASNALELTIAKQHLQNSNGDYTPIENLYDRIVEYLSGVSTWAPLVGSVVLPLYASISPKDISRIKLRSPVIDRKDFMVIEDPYETTLGLFGLGWEQYRSLFNTQEMDPIYVTEGEFDVLSLMAATVATGIIPRFPLVSSGGNSGSRYLEPILLSVGASKVMLVSDAPEKKGDKIVEMWLNELRELKVAVFTGWSNFSPANDLDDAVKAFGERTVSIALVQKINENFTSPGVWAARQAYAAIQGKEAGGDELDTRDRLELISAHGNYILNEVYRADFCKSVIEYYPDLNVNRIEQSLTVLDDTEENFIANCCKALRREFYVLGHTQDDNGSKLLVLFHIEKRTYHYIKLGFAPALESQLANHTGPLQQYFLTRVGTPACFLACESKPNPMIARAALMNAYAKEICNTLAVGTSSMSDRKYKQGYHYIQVENKVYEYFINGGNVFKLTRSETGYVTYTALTGPCDPESEIYFDTQASETDSQKAWLPYYTTVEALESINTLDIKAIYEELVAVLDRCFCFKRQSVTPELVAGFLLTNSVATAAQRPPMLFITGESESGKSGLMGAFGFGNPHCALTRSTHGVSNFSLAAVCGIADSDSRTLALDEFESKGDSKKAAVIDSVMELFRTLAGGESDRTKGQATGSKTTKQWFKMPLLVSAINRPAQVADSNRYLPIEMHKVALFENPAVSIPKMLGERQASLCNEVSVALQAHIPQLQACEKEVIKEMNQMRSDLILKLEDRFASSMHAPLALMRMLGLDWKSYILRYAEVNAEMLNVTVVGNEADNTLAAILRNPVVTYERNKLCSLAELLASSERRSFVNSSEFGTYFDEVSKCLLLLVDTVAIKLVPLSLQNKGLTALRLKNILDRHKHILSQVEVNEIGILTRVGAILGANIKCRDVVVIRATDWVTLPVSAVSPPHTATSATTTAVEETTHGTSRLDFDANDSFC